MPVLDTPVGALPTGPIVRGLTGADVAALGSLPLGAALVVRPTELGGFLTGQALLGAVVLAAYLLLGGRPSPG
ncbi:hypothetical protein HS048_32495 [Planomonospora sp. ID91781]|uniref:hypothetical protein n=1 Tax=Planomonospora sp. ID91781 TaxID=2738135 RepID=UPI0018C3FAB8|nr:hypothetical protein [Planomonospora sp. ID91781]MBG0825411.1 hypothetical protein [Planomonospora sp. ID91781]